MEINVDGEKLNAAVVPNSVPSLLLKPTLLVAVAEAGRKKQNIRRVAAAPRLTTFMKELRAENLADTTSDTPRR
jgi:hypothetical protein